MSRRAALVLVVSGAVAYGPAALGAAASLTGTVGPGFTITLADASGASVTRLDAGTYELTVRDLSEDHNFHLSGPGVNESTTVEGTGTVTWTVTLRNGRYMLVCDPHSSQMQRLVTVGAVAPIPPPKAPPPIVIRRTRLLATIGPGRTITLRSASGAKLQGLTAGPHAIVVRDRSKAHNFHLVGPGVNRRSGVAQTGTSTWNVTLRKGTLRFYSDRAATTIKGAIAVR